MENPLVRIARDYDNLAMGVNGFSLSKLLENLISRDKYDVAISTYAAYISALTQDVQLGSFNIHEEPQTSSLFGLLASSFWHANILNNLAIEAENEENHHGEEPTHRAMRQWIYQDKKQEAEYGFDFGIATSLPDGEIKITIFQAKRPINSYNRDNISLGHRVREKSGRDLPFSWEEMHEEIFHISGEISDNATLLSPRELKRLQKKLDNLIHISGNFPAVAAAVEQKDALRQVREIIKETDNLQSIIEALESDMALTNSAVRHGNQSLFNTEFSYLQHEAFLSLAVAGWTHDARDPVTPNWCHYVQWVNGGNSQSWSTSLQSALRSDGRMDDMHQRFASTLARALSPSNRSIGLILPRHHVRNFAPILLDKSPNLTWGVTADTQQLAYEILLELRCPPEQVMQPLGAANIVDRQAQRGLDDERQI